jgi:hypothetical protein
LAQSLLLLQMMRPAAILLPHPLMLCFQSLQSHLRQVLRQLQAQRLLHWILQLHCCWLQECQIQTQIHLLLVRCWLQVLMWLQVLLLSLQEPQTRRRVCHQLGCQTLVRCQPQGLLHRMPVQMLLLVLHRCWHQTGLVCCLLLGLRLMLQSRRLQERQSRRSCQMLAH